jgi:hypothetical protein
MFIDITRRSYRASTWFLVRSSALACLIAVTVFGCGGPTSTDDAGDATSSRDSTVTDTPMSNDVTPADATVLDAPLPPIDVPELPDVQGSLDVSLDVPFGFDVPPRFDVPSNIDVPSTLDAPSRVDVPSTLDAPSRVDVPSNVDVRTDTGTACLRTGASCLSAARCTSMPEICCTRCCAGSGTCAGATCICN